MEKFICLSSSKEHFDHAGKSLGMTGNRGLYYSKSLGKRRVYRSAHPDPDNRSFALFKFDSEEKASALCVEINEVYNDDFIVVKID